MFNYPVILTPDDGTVLVTFPDVPEAITFGANEEQALSHTVDALETALSFYVDDRKSLPVPIRAARYAYRPPNQPWNLSSWLCTVKCWRKGYARPSWRGAWVGKPHRLTACLI